ncbi:hypothetical protein HKX48_006637 [Thoreauomyces humboldtii]|nr:hypothetical protein HKX48_006637 [Thoreauomyces humboldtii]
MKFTSTVALAAIALASTAYAAPAPALSSTGASFSVNTYQRTPVFVPLGSGAPKPASLSGHTDDKTAALAYIAKELGLSASDLAVTDDYTGTSGARHIYVKRVIAGNKVANQVGNVSIKDGKVISFGSSIATAQQFGAPKIDSAVATVTLAQAQAAAEKATGLKVLPSFKAVQHYTETAEGVYEYAWNFQVKSQDADPNLQWYSIDVSAKTGKIIRANSFVHKAKYSIVKFDAMEPSPVKDLVTVTDPQAAAPNLKASPKGWHNDGSKSYTTTQGNNVNSAKAGKTASGGAALDFSTKYDLTAAADSTGNAFASKVNLFSVVNNMHDLFWQYGFNEAAGNFQTDNWGLGGQGGDAVQVSVQDNGGTDNANFATPPDGQQPQMNMYIFDETKPTRDGGMENDIPIHEFTHGISNRLTGGPSNTECLNNNEAGGMGEGWSDTTAVFIMRKADQTRDTDIVMGTWVENNTAGIRSVPYSTSLTRNPLMYSAVAGLDEVHSIGEVWCTMWNEVYWNLVDTHGFASNIWDATQTQGNVVALQLFIDSLALQPCTPTFVQARDAIIQADATRYKGVNKCAIWTAFAKRGLGVTAKNYKDDHSVPADCKGWTPGSTGTPTSPTTPTTTPAHGHKTTAAPEPTTTAEPTPTTTDEAPTPTPTDDCPWWDDSC